MKAVFITEGKKDIGFGHVTRCLGITKAFEEKNIETLLIINGDNSILNLVKEEKYKIIDWIKYEDKLLNLIKKDDIVFIDSYLAEFFFYEKISRLAKQVVYIDDNNRLPYPKGIVLNGNIYAASLAYPKKKDLIYLLGPKYAPIRKEFWDSQYKYINKKIKNILITFGGDDKRNLTPKVLSVLQKNYPNLFFQVIIGSGFKNKLNVKILNNNKTELIIDPNPIQIKELMLKSDIAVSASGQTTLELLRLRIPTVIIVVADNQKNIANVLIKKGLAEYAGNWKEELLLDKLNKKVKKLERFEARKRMSELQKNIVDGQGARRIVNFLINEKPVKVLFLSNNKISLDLATWLEDIKKENVIIYNKKLTVEIINKLKPDFLISYNYKYIISKEILDLFPAGRAINLHISYLPWNRGSNPNFWSFMDGTVKGVTVHVLDKGIDTGDILIQKNIVFNIKKETLSTSYLKLHKLIKKLFKENWINIKNLKIKPVRQQKGGSVHTQKEFESIKLILTKFSWDIPINKLIAENKKNLGMIEKIKIRKAQLIDSSYILDISNQTDIRKSSFNVEPISISEHKKWLANILKDKNHLYFVAETRKEIVGQVRAAILNENAIVSISVSNKYRKNKIGYNMITYLLGYLKLNKPNLKKVIAEIKEGNLGSIYFFKSLGFKYSKEIRVGNNKAKEYIYSL